MKSAANVAGIEEITEAYRALLGREPDEGGLRTHLQARLSPEALRKIITSSPEYQARSANTSAAEIASAYRILLSREPSEPVVQLYLTSQLSPPAVARSIMLSPEFRERHLAIKTIVAYGLEFVVRVTESMYERDYEPHVFKELMRRIRPGVNFLDVGANIGLFSVHAAKRGANVIAIEPKPSNTPLLLANARRNSTHIELHPVGASANAGYAVLQLSENANAGIRQLEATSVGDEVIATQRIDTIIESRQVDIIKIDIEGHEYSAMLGAHKLLSRCRP